MKRREFITLLGGAAMAWPLAARAQQVSKLPTIGFLGSGTPTADHPWTAAFVQRLRELGWIEGRTIAIEYRWGNERGESYAAIAAELVRLKVDVIVTAGLKGHTAPVVSAAFSGDGKQVMTASDDNTARIWDVTWALVRGGLRERVCAEKLVGAAQQFTEGEIRDDPILRGIDIGDPIARNPCLRRGPLSLDYWTRLPGQLWRSIRWLGSAN